MNDGGLPLVPWLPAKASGPRCLLKWPSVDTESAGKDIYLYQHSGDRSTLCACICVSRAACWRLNQYVLVLCKLNRKVKLFLMDPFFWHHARPARLWHIKTICKRKSSKKFIVWAANTEEWLSSIIYIYSKPLRIHCSEFVASVVRCFFLRTKRVIVYIVKYLWSTVLVSIS